MKKHNDAAQLIGIDWGSTGLRVFLIGAQGSVLQTRSSQQGALQLRGSDAYARVLRELAGDWLDYRDHRGRSLPLLASGMVGSQHGWRTAPYVACPSNAGELAQSLMPIDDTAPWICPGLIVQTPGLPPDVMRGEETQIVGALELHPELAAAACLILPGTHSKWVNVQHAQILDFATHMTGELFAVLSRHSVLGFLIPAEPEPVRLSMAAFDKGVDTARDHHHSGLSHQLFSVRTLGLTGAMSADSLADYLSGLLIGHELLAGLAWRSEAGLDAAPLVLIGATELCAMYRQALTRLAAPVPLVLHNTAPHGLWKLATQAGLINTSISLAGQS
ncbi:2-dehydro-3-deoxygalactonokinase [Sapientia aquatica]|uniref:2-dehydro-3-deoxygalactonokinase n=1 Tax=Sapientia aquatica TaxID=1549640 RepID=UPI001980E60C|nr:2-dehydro-3-deoxygalactonokinase [Sapientia aquatica]